MPATDDPSNLGNYHCQQCGRLLGVVRPYGAFTRLEPTWAPGALIYKLYGECECGAQIHWVSGDKANKRRIRHLIAIAVDIP
jgi:hypothetical protein